jgi:2-C-methyl-D-erythritol 4-phosphate cytidylyltransferase
MPVSLIIPAAGRGQRFGSPQPKQFLLLAGQPVLARSLAAFAGLVAEAVVAVDAHSEAAVTALLAAHPPPFKVILVAGGATRQDSVHAALRATSATSTLVLVHDAVRPLVPRHCIASCLAALTRTTAALVAVPCSATVKRASSAGGSDQPPMVAETVPRELLWLAQTPQGFARAAGLSAFARAAAEGWQCSDDAQLLERAGHPVELVMGDARNLKITTRDDWMLAEALVGAGGR